MQGASFTTQPGLLVAKPGLLVAIISRHSCTTPVGVQNARFGPNIYCRFLKSNKGSQIAAITQQ